MHVISTDQDRIAAVSAAIYAGQDFSTQFIFDVDVTGCVMNAALVTSTGTAPAAFTMADGYLGIDTTNKLFNFVLTKAHIEAFTFTRATYRFFVEWSNGETLTLFDFSFTVVEEDKQ